MQNKRVWLFLTLYGVLLVSAVASALKGSRTKFKIATTSTTTPSTTTSDNQSDNESSDDNSEVTTPGDVNATTGHTLTGIPQIDYIWDPNLPRELNGYNLSEYPFYSSIPKEEIDFKCDGLHDGFYASVPHKCQVYHHCLYGTRYDFLCANFTAFDQKTFICHFVSEVDCANSKKYWHRNDALYKAITTTTVPSPTTSTTSTTTTIKTTTIAGDNQSPIENPRLTSRRRIRPFRRRPAYDYYYDDELYYDDDYERPRVRGNYDRREEYDYDDRQYSKHNRERDRDYRDSVPRSRDPPERATRPRDRFPSRNNRREPTKSDDVDDAHRSSTRNHEDRKYDRGFTKPDEDVEPTAEGMVKPVAPSSSVYARPRVPPKIRRPVPFSEKEKFAYKTSVQTAANGETYRRTTEPPTLAPLPTAVDDYYDDEVEDTRTRRPMRIRRPYRERERHFYDQSRDRDRDRPFRPRYREDEDEMRMRKYPERQRERDHYYERNRDRALDRDKDYDRALPDRERDQGGLDRNNNRRPIVREKDEVTKAGQKEELKNNKESHYDDEDRQVETELLNQPVHKYDAAGDKNSDKIVDKDLEEGKRMKVNDNKEDLDKHKLDDDYEDYYDAGEYPSSSLPPPVSTKTPAIRVVKRPFLPSRGGSPIPRGLSPVGGKALSSSRNDNYNQTPKETVESHSNRGESPEDKRTYKAAHDNDEVEKTNPNEEINLSIKETTGSNSVQWRPNDEQLTQHHHHQRGHHTFETKPPSPWGAEEYRRNLQSANLYDFNQNSFTTEKPRKDTTDTSNLAIKQKLNEVPHQLQDIPESEYDVTLNEALTPSFHQDSTLSNGFVVSHHRPLNREPVLQSSENNYRISRPFNNKPQQLNHQSKSTFIPSPQFIPLTRVNNEQSSSSSSSSSSSLQYFKTPEAVRVPSSPFVIPSVQQSRSTWREYTPNYS